MAEDRAGAWDPFILLDLRDRLDWLDRLDRPLQANTR